MRIGIDLGGTKGAGVMLDTAGALVAAERQPTPRGDYAATIRRVVEVVQALEAAAGATGTVGVGVPGSLSRLVDAHGNRLWQGSNANWMNGRAVPVDLRAALGRELRIANDANCFALSEATDGAGAGYRTVFGVILGSGVGGGLVVDGRLVEGRNGVAGE